MRSTLALLALGIGVYLAVCLVRFPASVAYRWFAPDELALAVIDGTVWNGSAVHGGMAGLPLANIQWQLRPLALLTGRVDATAQADFADGFASADVDAARNRMSLSNVTASTNLQTFAQLLPVGGIRGQISLQLDQIEFVDGWPVAATGEARIANLAVPPAMPIAGVTLVPLGNFAARFVPSSEPGITSVLNDQGGPLELSGRLDLMPDRRFLIDTLVRTRPEATRELVQGIEFATESPNASGQRRFRLDGSL